MASLDPVPPRPWRRALLTGALAACVLFAMLTAAAMLAYPGGTYLDPGTRGFSPWNNFLSDLGRTRTRLGGEQLASRVLFTLALLGVAAGLAAFFSAFAGLAQGDRLARLLARVGSACGCVAAAAFAGVALVPSDLDLVLHDRLVQWAFRAFLAAVLCYLAALPRTALPRAFTMTFAAFAVLLAGYVVLITFGPSPRSPGGQLVQASGQKMIVVAAIACVGVQAWRARRLCEGSRGPG